MNTDADDDGSSAALFGRRCRKCGSCSISLRQVVASSRLPSLSLLPLSCLFVATLLPLPAFVTFPLWNGAPLTKASVVAVVRLRVRHRPPAPSELAAPSIPRFLSQVVRGSERELRCRRGLSTLSLSSQSRLIDGRLAHSFSSASRCMSPNCADNADSPPFRRGRLADRLLRSRKFPAPVQPTSTSEKCSVDLAARMERTEGGQKGRAAGRSIARTNGGRQPRFGRSCQSFFARRLIAASAPSPDVFPAFSPSHGKLYLVSLWRR